MRVVSSGFGIRLLEILLCSGLNKIVTLQARALSNDSQRPLQVDNLGIVYLNLFPSE